MDRKRSERERKGRQTDRQGQNEGNQQGKTKQTKPFVTQTLYNQKNHAPLFYIIHYKLAKLCVFFFFA